MPLSESTFTQRLLRSMRIRMPFAVVLKHNDAVTGGIPDFSVPLNGKTSWFEVKLMSNRLMFRPLQLAMLQRMRGDYVIWDTVKRQGCLLPAIDAPGVCASVVPYKELVDKIIAEVKR